MATAKIEWVDIKERRPKINFLASDMLLFVADGKVYPGRYHENGCFYSDECNIAARTIYAEKKYGISQLPDKVATHWAKLPEPPEQMKASE